MIKKRLIVLLPDCSLKGGAEQYLNMIASQAIKEGDSVHVFFMFHKSENEWSTHIPNLYLHLNKYKRKRYGVMFLLLGLWSKRRINFDYAFTSHVFLTCFVGILRKLHLLKIKYVVGRESTSIFKRFKGLEQLQFNIFYHIGYHAVDLLICQTEYIKKQLLENLPWMEKKVNVQVVPNPVNLDNMLKKSKEKLKMPTDKPFVVAAGRFIPEKGFDILLKSFARLKTGYDDLKLVILGDIHYAHQMKTKEEMLTIISKLGLKNDVILPGTVENVYPYFKNARMCVVSSRIEGFPNVLLQMMSQNEKVVSTLCAGDIDKLEGVFTCKINDEDDLLRAMKACLEADTSDNRERFDNELQSRSIDKFIERIKSFENAKVMTF
jgi:glycosyltransferase involved in cell wall biosynthesis